jgi:hypothetical protein
MSDYELFYNATNPNLECGWFWRMRCGWAGEGKSGTGWMIGGPFSSVDEARADAEEEVGPGAEEDDQ